MRLALSAAFLLLALLAAAAYLGADDPQRAERLYRDGRYGEAYEALRVEAAEAGDRPALAYDAGNALYRLGRYEEALPSFRRAGDGPPRLRQRAAYNMGNAYVRAAEASSGSVPPVLRNARRWQAHAEAAEVVRGRDEGLRRAIAAYEEALRLDPRDADAKWNLELALRRLEEEPVPGGGGRRYRATWGRGSMDRSGRAGSPEAAAGAVPGGGAGAPPGEAARELTEAEARQLLEAVQRAQLDARSRSPQGGGPPAGRDW